MTGDMIQIYSIPLIKLIHKSKVSSCFCHIVSKINVKCLIFRPSKSDCKILFADNEEVWAPLKGPSALNKER